MAKIEQQIESAHNWVHLAPRQEVRINTGYHKHLGSKSTVVDQLYVPFLDTTYVLVFESTWGTTGGIQKDAVLYAHNHRADNSREMSRHTISNGRDAMSGFYPTKISAVISFVTKDFPISPELYGEHKSGETFRAGAFHRKSQVQVRISMQPQGANVEMSGLYEVGHLEYHCGSPWSSARWEQKTTSSQRWTTGNVEGSVLTKRNISRFYGKYTSELPAIPETKAG